MPAKQNIYLWDKANAVWVEAPACVATEMKVATGQVIAGAHKLYWISCNPSAAASEWALSDDTDGSTATLLEHHHPDRESHNTNLIPPMSFATGIYLKTFTNMTSMTFGYV